jgi:hypothetical protein
MEMRDGTVNDDNFTMQVPAELGDVTLTKLAQICLAENERRLAPYDERLLRPRFVPRLVRWALRTGGQNGNGAGPTLPADPPAAMRGPIPFRELVAVVTGASSGIGERIARDLAARGTRVALVARRADRLAALAREIERDGGHAFPVPCDVGERAGVAAAVRQVIDRHGSVDVLVNAAGYGAHVLFRDHPVDDIERMTRTNWLGTVYAVKAVLPSMRAQRRGWIVNVASSLDVWRSRTRPSTRRPSSRSPG